MATCRKQQFISDTWSSLYAKKAQREEMLLLFPELKREPGGWARSLRDWPRGEAGREPSLDPARLWPPASSVPTLPGEKNPQKWSLPPSNPLGPLCLNLHAALSSLPLTDKDHSRSLLIHPQPITPAIKRLSRLYHRDGEGRGRICDLFCELRPLVSTELGTPD